MNAEADIVNGIIKDIRKRLILDGRNRVFDEGKKLKSEFMKERAEAEAFTKEFLIEKIFNISKYQFQTLFGIIIFFCF